MRLKFKKKILLIRILYFMDKKKINNVLENISKNMHYVFSNSR